jgi:UDP-N-acetylmuramoylalanine--D-glutamate ligase
VGETALVYGLAVAGEACVQTLALHGWTVVVADDSGADAVRSTAQRLDVDVVVAPGESELAALVARADLVVPAPGVPEHHRLFGLTAEAGVPVRSEIDLAWEWEQDRAGGPRPMLAITGTDGKTTTTLLATAMLQAAGCRAVAAGNTEVPLVSALDFEVDAFVVECTSFRLAWTTCFRPLVGTWLNLAADHLDWHTDLSSYEQAKARIWRFQHPSDVAIGYAPDPIVMRNLAEVAARPVTFARDAADYRVAGGELVGPAGPIVAVERLARRLPHDLTNSLAAAATVLEAGLADTRAVAGALVEFRAPHHRLELVAEHGGVAWYDDSKATTPHATLSALQAFPSVVLIAGGKNKGLDLSALAAEAGRVRAVVAIGAAAPEVEAAFAGRSAVVTAESMDAAVAAAGERAVSGDTVLLSPACASFDWYRGYGERGDDFARAVRARLGKVTS